MKREANGLKTKVLAALMRSDGNAVSGERLAQTLGVTRTAVWKAMRALKEDGVRIEGQQNTGYTLIEMPDILSQESVSAHLKRTHELHLYDSLPSTNTTAKRLAAEGAPSGTVVAANMQTEGRGRRARDFYSPKGTGVYFSVIYRPELRASMGGLLTTAAAVAVAETIEELTGNKPGIKWVNDVYVDGKKVCGILTECTFAGENGEIESAVVGIGINVTTADFPDELKARAGSIRAANVSRTQVLAGVVNRLTDAVEAGLTPESVLPAYRSYSFLPGKRVRVESDEGVFFAVADGITDTGELCVTDESGKVHFLRAQEVSVREDA